MDLFAHQTAGTSYDNFIFSFIIRSVDKVMNVISVAFSFGFVGHQAAVFILQVLYLHKMLPDVALMGSSK